MTKLINFLGYWKTIAFFLVVSSLVILWCIPKERVLKRDKEIDDILRKTFPSDYCMQYALIVTKAGWFPCYECATGQIYLQVGNVWKYGKTCKDECGRYPKGLPYKDLFFQPQFFGTEQASLVAEKEKIYAYPALPECQIRAIKLLRPPGNKIDR